MHSWSRRFFFRKSPVLTRTTNIKSIHQQPTSSRFTVKNGFKLTTPLTLGLLGYLFATHGEWNSYCDDTNGNKMIVFFIVGGPGAGKGTQCAKLHEIYPDIISLSTGQLLRQMSKERKTPRAIEVCQ